jgi:mannose-6-phosphate isomerase
MVWGGRSLVSLNKALNGSEAYGESWEVSDHASHHSVVANGPLAGTTLRQLMEQSRDALLGPAASRYSTFPWLFKFLDACDWLSVQVHPDDVRVKQWWPGEGGKTEAWFILQAQAASRIYAGLLPGVGPAEFRKALEQGRAQECLHSFAPQAGQCVFLPAGTVHAVGGGVLMAEIQQTSDATFRLFDWNRRDAHGKSRTLHIEEGMACIDWQQGPVEPLQVPNDATDAVMELVRCPYFHLDYIHQANPFTIGGSGRLQLLAILRGHGTWRHPREDLAAGQVWLLPADLPALAISPALGLSALLCSLPSPADPA